jgi:hypothetical protein
MLCCAVQDRDLEQRSKGGLACHFFSTFFLNKLFVDENKYNYQNVSATCALCCILAAGGRCGCVFDAPSDVQQAAELDQKVIRGPAVPCC